MNKPLLSWANFTLYDSAIIMAVISNSIFSNGDIDKIIPLFIIAGSKHQFDNPTKGILPLLSLNHFLINYAKL